MGKDTVSQAFPVVKITWAIIQTLWFFGLICAVLSVIIIVIGLFGAADTTFEVPLSASVNIGHADGLAFSNPGAGMAVISLARYEAPVIIGSLNNLQFSVRLLLCAVIAVAVTAFLMILYHLRAIVWSVKQGHPFERPNSRRLRIIAYTVMAIGPAIGLIRYVISIVLLQGIELAAAHLEPTLDLHLVTVLLGLLILVTAIVFDVGVRVQRESDLTV